LYERLGYAAASLVAIGIAAAALVLALFRIRETHKPAVRPGGRHRPWRQEWRGLPGRSILLLVMVLTFGVMFAYAFAQPQFMFYAYDDLSLTSSQLGLVMGAYGVSFMAGAFALGRLSDCVGRKPVLALGLVLFAAQFAGLIVFHEVSWIVVSFIIAGMGNALYDPPLSALILDTVPPEHSTSVLGLKSTAGSIGSTLGPALVVLLAPSMKPQEGFLAATALVAILVIVSALLPHRGRRAEAAAQP
jgi:predicted MFS family arabinose efflux permease